ncbi:unnamed protein product [Cuscuta epithymum]|uniref:Pectate lyase superfamily protein domain-containing protein n=1 Tax=Cuscuta epithymum TaxID=186058 RepID=A0AAV0DWF1_9ASTE|nr:unnamed protein product [Cuscuta epithymum]CAH9141275.1 unnamed protein product [Cuscuta epithymum]
MGVTSRMPFPLLSIVLLATAAIFTSNVNNVHGGSHLDHHINIKRMKDKVLQRPQLPSNSYGEESARVYHVTSYGADPTGKYDSTDAILRAIKNATSTSSGVLFDQIQNLGGARVDLDGGIYVISRPLQLPTAGLGNLVVTLSHYSIASSYNPTQASHVFRYIYGLYKLFHYLLKYLMKLCDTEYKIYLAKKRTTEYILQVLTSYSILSYKFLFLSFVFDIL